MSGKGENIIRVNTVFLISILGGNLTSVAGAWERKWKEATCDTTATFQGVLKKTMASIDQRTGSAREWHFYNIIETFEIVEDRFSRLRVSFLCNEIVGFECNSVKLGGLVSCRTTPSTIGSEKNTRQGRYQKTSPNKDLLASFLGSFLLSHTTGSLFLTTSPKSNLWSYLIKKRGNFQRPHDAHCILKHIMENLSSAGAVVLPTDEIGFSVDTDIGNIGLSVKHGWKPE